MQYKFRLKIVKFLLDVGADINAQNANKQTPLDLAIKKDNTEMAELIISYSKLLKQIQLKPTKQLFTQAIDLGYVHAVKLLLQADIKPDVHDLVLAKQKYVQSSDKLEKDTYATIGRMLLKHLRLIGKLQTSQYKPNALTKPYRQIIRLLRSTADHTHGPISKSGLGLPEDIAHTIASFMY